MPKAQNIRAVAPIDDGEGKESTDKTDTDFDYCLITKCNNQKVKADPLDNYITIIKKFGFKTKIYYDIGKDYSYLLIKSPYELLQKTAMDFEYDFLLDPKVLQRMASTGIPEKDIAPFKINHIPQESSIEPFEYMYASYTNLVPDEIYWRPVNKKDPFNSLIRLKLTMNLLESKPTDKCDKIQIRSSIRSGKIAAFFPLHVEVEKENLRSLWLKTFHFPWNEPLDSVKEYFGEKVALYFLFMNHVITWLILPAIIGTTIQAMITFTPIRNTSLLSIFSIFIVLWAIVMLEFWKRKEKCKLKSGT